MLTTYTRSGVWSIFVAVLLLLAGLMAIALPFFAGIAASVFFGWLLMIAGIAHLVYAWSERGAGAVLWQILIGIAYLIAALYMLVLPVAGVVTLTLVLAFYYFGRRHLRTCRLLSPSRAAWNDLVSHRRSGFVPASGPHLFPLAIEFAVGCRHLGGDQSADERHREDYFAAESASHPRLDRHERSHTMKIARRQTRPFVMAALIALFTLLLSLTAYATKAENAQLTQLLADANDEAFELARDATDTQMLIRTDENWVDHALMLAKVKGHVDNLALIIEKMSKAQKSGSELQEQAVEQAEPGNGKGRTKVDVLEAGRKR